MSVAPEILRFSTGAGKIIQRLIRSSSHTPYLCFMKSLLIVGFIALAYPITAQQREVMSNADSTLVIEKDARFDAVVDQQKKINLMHPVVPGYRVQIYFGGNRPKASETKLDFTSRYPEYPAYLTYQQPNYKVRVGDFRNRFDALQFMKKIQGEYPTTFVVPDDVKLPSIK